MRKQYSPKKKAKIALEILKEEQTIAQLASKYSVHPSQLYKWRKLAQENLSEVFEDKHKGEKVLKAEYESRIKDLYAEIGKLSTQLTWLKKKSGIEVYES